MSVRVGTVIAVSGVKITLRIDDSSSRETLFFQGEKYKGVSIREYLAIQRGFRTIICIVDGEYLDENRVEIDGAKVNFVRRVEARSLGHMEDSVFRRGVKYMPMIGDAAHLLQESRIAAVFGESSADDLKIGTLLKEGVRVGLPWRRLFNTHIGIFGNTGSGKSNTLATLFTSLFDSKLEQIAARSRFVIFDFNGEYTGRQIAPEQAKRTFGLSTHHDDGDFIPISDDDFWNLETLSILFQATPHTQRPFLRRLLDGHRRFRDLPDSLVRYAQSTIRMALSTASPRPEVLGILRTIAGLLGDDNLSAALARVSWHATNRVFYSVNDGDTTYFGADGAGYDNLISPIVDQLQLPEIDAFDDLLLRSLLQLARELLAGFVQFDHIQPLLKRLEASLSGLRRVVHIQREDIEERPLTVISFRKCDSEIKKVLPLLLAKHYYNTQRARVAAPPDRTLHLIIDEAHNILSQQSSRESESWKDYRLEMFEEIIKEGRKFGVFVTVSSQRPADISPTIVSQLHNYFIHRLVNDRDLFLVENVVSSLDSVSRSLIPSLAQGSCVVTGTSFDLPMVLQVDPLSLERRPDSGDVDLDRLWN